jgi:PmbA protein
MNNGIIIIDTFGNGLNLVTGDYSVGAGGLIVENGEILGYSENLTISGNLRDIFQNILYVNNNYNSGHIQCGDMLINAEIIQVSSN